MTGKSMYLKEIIMTEISGQKSQPEQQSRAHDSSEGQRRALQLIEEYADDISIDEYDFNDEIRIQPSSPPD